LSARSSSCPRPAAAPGATRPAPIRIAAIGKDVAIRPNDDVLVADSGQLLLDFGPTLASSAVWSMSITRQQSAQQDDGYRLFTDAERLEHEGRSVETENVYRKALKFAPPYVDAAVNLSCLLCDEGRYRDAVRVLEDALGQGAKSPLLLFNLGVALEDAGDLRDALAAYQRCIDEAPDFADAHFNAARLHEALGDTARAIRHFNEYRAIEKTRN
jgi:tetratricopeptide (TPR) repeat protein